MTCIVGYVEKGKVYIGGDNLASDRIMNKQPRVDEKIFMVKNMLFGFTTSYRMGQLLQYSFYPPIHPKGVSDMKYLVNTFIPKLLKAYREFAFIPSDAITGGEFLLGYKGHLYHIESDFQVAESSSYYDACGSGEHYSLGALHVLRDYKMTPEERVIKALSAATQHCTTVAPPYKVMSI